jgi:hypothetical protein
MPPNVAETRIPRSNLAVPVGELDHPLRPRNEWLNANIEKRSRVYMIRKPRSTKKQFVSIDGRVLTTNRRWTVTTRICGLMSGSGGGGHRCGHHNPTQRMQGKHRAPGAPNININGAAVVYRAQPPPPQPPLQPRPQPPPSARPPLPASADHVNPITPVCTICLDDNALASCVWCGCGHRVACLACAGRVTAPSCPVCRTAGWPLLVRDP